MSRRIWLVAIWAVALAGQNAGAPVVSEGQTLFTIRVSLGPFSAADRAAAAGARILQLARDLTIPVDAVTAAPSDSSTDLVARDRVLLTITDADAAAAGVTRAQLAAAYVADIRSAIERRRAEYSTRSLLIGSGYTALATLAMLALLWSIRRVYPAARRKLVAARGGRIRAVRLQQAELLSAETILRFLARCLFLARAVAVLLVLYFYVPLVLSFFPWTREYAPQIFGYFTAPLRAAGAAAVGYLPSLAVIVLAALAALLCIRLSHFLFDQLERGTISWAGFYPEWAQPTHKIVRSLILAVMVIVMFPYLPGAESPAFKGVSIFVGVLVSLGSSSAVSNVVAGTILTYTRAFQVGDRVRIADTTGDVLEKTLLATRLQTIKNEVVTVPNSMVLGSHVTNFSSSGASGNYLILHTTVTIGYDAPWRTVHGLLIEAAGRTAAILAEPKPFVLQTALDDFYVHYQINAYTAEPARMAVTYAELHQNIQDAFNEAGVEIMSPHFASLRDGGEIAIPAKYRDARRQAASS